ncbi:MAG: DUF2292 domain-containing protein [Proteobacteria bacterium]|nr:DUF2292 domain-containing protein [Pseudomonadota bacterium]
MVATLDKKIPNDVEKHILDAISEVRYGAVEVLIHDSKVVQIEKSEKTRFDNPKK